MVELAQRALSNNLKPGDYLPAGMDRKKPSITEKYNSNLQRSIPAPCFPITQSKFAWYNHTCLPTPAKIEIHSSHTLLNSVVTKSHVKYSWITECLSEVSFQYPDIMNVPIELV
eukprot:7941670-Ditylum_brightwellii.AAC.1